MKLAVVVQRYGAELNGGAELHARYVSELLARHAEVEVLTTCARDYITWRNELAEGTEHVNGIQVRRFPVAQERDPREFGNKSEHVFNNRHSIAEELDWLKAEGPTSPALINYLQQAGSTYDYVIFFSYRYFHTYHGIRTTSERAILVPTAERDPALGLTIFGSTFRNVRAVMYNSHEERALIQHITQNHSVPNIVVGIGSDVPATSDANRFRARTKLREPFVLYVGRIDKNKGCDELFDYFCRYSKQASSNLQLVVIGEPVMPVPEHPQITHLGFVTDEEKYDAMAAATLLVMPSYYESLSMVIIEAWAMRIPVLVNGKCDVLKGQTIRANAGLYYETYDEFLEALQILETNRELRNTLAAAGRTYYEQHYTWNVIESKYLSMLEKLGKSVHHVGNHESSDPAAGWLKKTRRVRAPAREVVSLAPTGPHNQRN